MGTKNRADAVKRWRNNTKAKIVEAMGGKCCVCGYDKCNHSLALHHINPIEKEISFGAIRANPKRWGSIVDELRKCVLVCHNCHSEIHADVIQSPSESSFDDRYSNYSYVTASFNTNECKVCGKPIPDHQETCSRTCTGRLGNIIDWDQIDLEQLLRTKSYTDISNDLGISLGAVSKRARKLGLTSKFRNRKHDKLCPVCGNIMGHRSLTCSAECNAIRQQKITWDSINLETELKTKSYVQIADELGVSDGAVHKRAKKLGLK